MDINTCIRLFIFGTELYSKYSIYILNHLNVGCEGERSVQKIMMCDVLSLKELHFSRVKGIQNVSGLI